MYKLNQTLRTKVPVFGLRPGTRLRVMSPRDTDTTTHVRAKVLDTRENIVKVFSLGTVTKVSRGRPYKDGSPAKAKATVEHYEEDKFASWSGGPFLTSIVF